MARAQTKQVFNHPDFQEAVIEQILFTLERNCWHGLPDARRQSPRVLAQAQESLNMALDVLLAEAAKIVDVDSVLRPAGQVDEGHAQWRTHIAGQKVLSAAVTQAVSELVEALQHKLD